MTKFAPISNEQVLEALRLWHGGEVSDWPLAKMRLGLQIKQKQSEVSSLADTGLATQNRSILDMGLEKLHEVSPQNEELLRQRFEHRRDVMAVANSLNVAQSSLYYRQRQAVSQLTDILNQLENEASSEWRARTINRLELPTYTELVGVEEATTLLMEALLEENDEHFIICIDGLGGLGKTALAHQLTQEIINTLRFEEIAWVTAKQTHLSTRGRLQIDSSRPALTFPMLIDELAGQFNLPSTATTSQLAKQRAVKQFLKEQACFVVIDNLETVADYQALLPELRQIQEPSKFLLTSRLRLIDQPGVFSYSLHELPESAAFELIRLEAERTGFHDLAAAGPKEFKQIFDVVGGNPLALKLVVGQLRFHSLPRVLTRLSESQTNDSGIGLFEYIYRESWESLGDDSKATLLALTQAGESGFTLEHITAVTQQTDVQVERCLEELILLSLVDQKGSLFERRYSLHRLTEMFLLRMFDET